MRRDVAIRVENLGKRYRIGQQRTQHTSLRDALTDAATAPYRRLRSALRGEEQAPQSNTFWALKDISFEIQHGEVVGVIGRNGAGKSTMLKLLTRITDPTEGRVELNGRVASLLEVGTGFHPELTGRENIYMNGAILGMTKREIEQKFDEIVAFAETEKFLDTPVKRYSSGMYVRLAFSVAAHLEPEILLVDEVLSVGDAQFQKKCLGKMGEVAKGGRTVLFVSHNMAAVKNLCLKGILLENGRLKQFGSVTDIVVSYISTGRMDSTYHGEHILKYASVNQQNGIIKLVADYEFDTPVTLPCLGFIISDSLGQPLFGTNPRWDDVVITPKPTKIGRIQLIIRKPKLCNGMYSISLWLGDGVRDLFSERDILSFTVNDNIINAMHRPDISGSIYPECEWNFI